MKKLLIATKNIGKITEFKELFMNTNIEVKSLLDYPTYIEPEESGMTFAENAHIKAKAAQIFFQMDTIADDSGLEVAALNNAPGVFSRRYSPSQKDSDNNDLLIYNLQGVTDRNARFVCVISFIAANGFTKSYRGEVEGIILTEKKGVQGFGYDPLFYIPQEQLTLAELSTELKNQYSHRSIAAKKFIEDYVGKKNANTSI